MTSRYPGSLAVGSPFGQVSNPEYNNFSDVNDANMLVGSQVIKNVDFDTTETRKDQWDAQLIGLQKDKNSRRR